LQNLASEMRFLVQTVLVVTQKPIFRMGKEVMGAAMGTIATGIAVTALAFVACTGGSSAEQSLATQKCPARSDSPRDEVIAGCLAAIRDESLATSDRAEVYLNLSGIYLVAKQYQPALDALNQSVRLRPDSAVAHEVRGLVYLLTGQYALAMADVDESIRLNPGYAAAFDLRGAIYQKLNQYEQSVADEDSAIVLEPKRAEAYNNRGYAYLGLGKYDEATADFSTALLLQPGYVQALQGRCRARTDAGRDLDAALADCTQSIEASIDNPGNRYILEERSLANLKLERYKQAIADADQSLKGDPKLPGALFLRGMAKRKSGDAAGGDADIAAAKAIDAKIAETFAGYGVTP
jgi:tetratricopeptide (TPR) repeat protein